MMRHIIKLFCGLCLSIACQAEITFVHTDHLGSVMAESDAERDVTIRYHYEPFGRAMEDGQDDDPGYTGHLYDKDLGVNDAHMRVYDPHVGRFYGSDPVSDIAHLNRGNIHGFNRYTYANNNPYTYTDPDGRTSRVTAHFSNRQLEQMFIDGSVGGNTSTNGCGCPQITGNAIQGFLDAWSNALAGSIQAQLRFMGQMSGLGSSMLNEESDNDDVSSEAPIEGAELEETTSTGVEVWGISGNLGDAEDAAENLSAGGLRPVGDGTIKVGRGGKGTVTVRPGGGSKNGGTPANATVEIKAPGAGRAKTKIRFR